MIFGDVAYTPKIYELARGVEIWLGLVNDPEEDVWKWITGEEADKVHWTIGQPNQYKSNEDCSILMNRHVNDVPCDYTLPFICQAQSVICPLPDAAQWPKHAQMVTESRDAGYALQESVQFKCEEGKVRDGDSSMITCLENGEFSAFDFECNQGCDPLPNIPMARPVTIMDQHPVGASVTYICSNRNRPTGNPTIQCGPDGSWSKPAFSCKSACHAPMRIQDSKQMMVMGDQSVEVGLYAAEQQQQLFAVGTKIIYQCNEGFTVRNVKRVPTAQCMQDGRWKTTNLQKCKRGCRRSDIPDIPNVREMGFGKRRRLKNFDRFYHYQEKIHYLCKRGYKSGTVLTHFLL